MLTRATPTAEPTSVAVVGRYLLVVVDTSLAKSMTARMLTGVASPHTDVLGYGASRLVIGRRQRDGTQKPPRVAGHVSKAADVDRPFHRSPAGLASEPGEGDRPCSR